MANKSPSGNPKPAHKIRSGALTVTIWRKQGEKSPWFSAELTRSYKQGEEWKESTSLGYDDLLTAAKLLDMAHSWIMSQSQTERPEQPPGKLSKRRPATWPKSARWRSSSPRDVCFEVLQSVAKYQIELSVGLDPFLFTQTGLDDRTQMHGKAHRPFMDVGIGWPRNQHRMCSSGWRTVGEGCIAPPCLDALPHRHFTSTLHHYRLAGIWTHSSPGWRPPPTKISTVPWPVASVSLFRELGVQQGLIARRLPEHAEADAYPDRRRPGTVWVPRSRRGPSVIQHSPADRERPQCMKPSSDVRPTDPKTVDQSKG